MKTFAVLLSGNGSNLQAIIDSGLKPNIVISNRPEAFGLIRAKEAGIAVKVIDHTNFSTRAEFDLTLQKAIDDSCSDIIVLAGFMRILTDDFINYFNNRIINIHPSLLPKYKGLHTHKRALESGDKKHGPTVHYVTPELDSGPIIAQAEFDIPKDIDETELQELVHQQEHKLYPKVIKELLS